MKGLITSTNPPTTCITMHHCRSKNPIKKCFTVTIFGQSIFTTLTSHRSVVTQWISDVLEDNFRHVGLEFEFDLNTNRIGTLQLCVGNRCLIFQLQNKTPLPIFLDVFLGSGNNLFIGNHIKSKIEKMKGQFPFTAEMNTRDLGEYVACMRDIKLREMESMESTIGEVDSNWDRMPYILTVKQVHYACLDAFLNLHIWKLLLRTFRFALPTDEETSITPLPEVVGANRDCYDVVVLGETILTTVPKHPDAVKEWIDAVSTVHIGFAIECDDTHGAPRVGTLQLCDGTRCLVLQLLNVQPLPLALRQFLADRKYTFVGRHKVQEDIDLLKRQYPFKGKVNCKEGWESTETRLWTKCRLLDVWLRENDWARHSELSHKQVHYASMDPFLHLHMAKKLGIIPKKP